MLKHRLHDVLARSLRPRCLDDLIGANDLIKRIRFRIESGRLPHSWLLCGQTGGGKTTLARIIARSLQCTHDKKFGASCSRCWKNRKNFDIDETNAARVRKVEEIEAKTDSYVLTPMPGSKYRIYIFDEAHQLSDHSQNLLLKLTEDPPSTTIFIFNTTQEEYILRTLRRRCKTYVMPGFQLEDIRTLVQKALHVVHSDRDSSDLVEKLMEKDVTSPGLILNAVENYVEGSTPEEASEVEAVSEITSKSICRQIMRGDWESVSVQLKKMKPEDIHAIQGAVSKYLLGVLLSDASFSSKSKVASKSILRLSDLNGQSDNVQMSALGAILYDVCHNFKKYSG